MKSIVSLVVIVGLAGCSDFSRPPKLIVADGSIYYACRGTYVRTFPDGLLRGDSYTVEFTDANGDWVQLRGVKKISVSDLQSTIWSSLPYDLPDPVADKDSAGKSFIEGEVYTRSKTEQFLLKNGKWERIKIPNPACEKSEDR